MLGFKNVSHFYILHLPMQKLYIINDKIFAKCQVCLFVQFDDKLYDSIKKWNKIKIVKNSGANFFKIYMIFLCNF